MQSPPAALKKALVSEGFEIYRTGPNLISLADRVRDNLLMDSGVSVVQGDGLAIRVILRAQATDFPGDDADGLFARARGLAAPLSDKGYREVSACAVPIKDPSDKERTLDTWYEVTYERDVGGEPELFGELRFVFSLSRVAARP